MHSALRRQACVCIHKYLYVQEMPHSIRKQEHEIHFVVDFSTRRLTIIHTNTQTHAIWGKTLIQHTSRPTFPVDLCMPSLSHSRSLTLSQSLVAMKQITAYIHFALPPISARPPVRQIACEVFANNHMYHTIPFAYVTHAFACPAAANGMGVHRTESMGERE